MSGIVLHTTYHSQPLELESIKRAMEIHAYLGRIERFGGGKALAKPGRVLGNNSFG